MVHKFGELERRDDPLGSRTFQPNFPNGISASGSGPINAREVGEYSYRPAPSAVQKAGGGFAKLSGPAPDYANECAAPTPASTSKRTGRG